MVQLATTREANRYMLQVLDERRRQQPRQRDKNTLSSLMSRVPMLESTNGFLSLRTFDVSNLSCGHLLFYFVVVNSICSILQKFKIFPFNKNAIFSGPLIWYMIAPNTVSQMKFHRHLVCAYMTWYVS